MSSIFNFLLSLLLTSFFSFAAPLLILAALLAAFGILSCIPFMGNISQSATAQIVGFLNTFGSGSPAEGLLTIGLTCALVGALFDAYALYRYQSLRS